MTTALEPDPLLFQPQRREHCPDDEGTFDPVYFFGEVICSGCQRPVSVSAQAGKVESGYCPFCSAQLAVAVHLRMDDSRPQGPRDSLGCVCGDPQCWDWEVA